MGLGPDSIKAALNLVSAICFAGVAVRYVVWTCRDWRALRPMTMGTMPISIALLPTAGAVERAYYGAARILTPHGYDIRSLVIVVTALGVAALAGVALHMIAIWRSDGVAVRPRVIRCGILIAAMWAGLTALLW